MLTIISLSFLMIGCTKWGTGSGDNEEKEKEEDQTENVVVGT